MKNTHYYITKIISIISILYSVYLIVIFIYSAYGFWLFTKNFDGELSSEELNHFNSLIGLAGFFVLAGIIGLIGSLGLFLFKKWGFYVMFIFILSLWGTSWMTVGGISENWFFLSVFSLILIYLVWQRKFILNYRNNLIVLQNFGSNSPQE